MASQKDAVPGSRTEPAAQAAEAAMHADRLDEVALSRRAQREPLPTSRAGFKRHSGYVLESQLSP